MIDDSNPVNEPPASPRIHISAEDRELLELTARAMGARFEEVEGEGYGNLYFANGKVVDSWNSLRFSDDALHVAVALNMDVAIGAAIKVACPIPTSGGKRTRLVRVEVDPAKEGVAPIEATKRAITRAAAEVVKSVG